MRALHRIELTDGQIEALLVAAELAEAAWWDDPVLHRRLAGLCRARRTLAGARDAPVDGARDHEPRAPAPW